MIDTYNQFETIYDDYYIIRAFNHQHRDETNPKYTKNKRSHMKLELIVEKGFYSYFIALKYIDVMELISMEKS